MESGKRLVTMVEGNSDEKFVNEIIKPLFIRKNIYKVIVPYKYAHRTKNDNVKFMTAVKSMNDDILCFGDIDSANSIIEKKRKIKADKLGDIADDNIIVVIKEIESWYLAGVTKSCCKRLGISYCDRTDNVGKDECYVLIAKSKYQPRINCMDEMLRNFDLNLAAERNKSFNYFHSKFLIELIG